MPFNASPIERHPHPRCRTSLPLFTSLTSFYPRCSGRNSPQPPGRTGCRLSRNSVSASSRENPFLYGRSDTMASKESATEMIRASREYSPFSPSGYPVPSYRSWWCRIPGRTSRSCSMGARMATPFSGWRRKGGNSSSERAAGFSRSASIIPILPMSCSSPPSRTRSISFHRVPSPWR